jgi:hypothetical protein
MLWSVSHHRLLTGFVARSGMNCHGVVPAGLGLWALSCRQTCEHDEITNDTDRSISYLLVDEEPAKPCIALCEWMLCTMATRPMPGGLLKIQQQRQKKA